MSAQREVFEVWAKKIGFPLDSEKGQYLVFYVCTAWAAWHEGQEAMQAEWDAESDAASEREIANTPWAKP